MSRNFPEELPKFPDRFGLGHYAFSLTSRELTDGAGAPVRLRKQTAEVLAVLLRHAGQTVSKSALFDQVWTGATVTDDSLVQCISELRRALGDRDHAIIQTISKTGYRVIAAPLPCDPAAPGPALHDPLSIAVLAFEDFSAGSDSNYLSDAIAECVIAELSRFPELAVIARNSSFSLRDTPTPVAEIARLLDARYLLEGSQQKNGNLIRVTAQLIDARAGHHLWSQTYDGDLDDIFAVQDDIVRRVVATVAQKIIKHEGRARARSTPAAHAALLHHLEARQHLIKFTPEANEDARRANLAAIKAGPDEPYGHAGLAFVHINGHRWGWTELSPSAALEAARASARRAVELGPDYYDSHAAMAYVHLQDNDLDAAIARAQRALDLNPNDTYVMSDLAEFFGYAGRNDEAARLLHWAMRLDPLYPDFFRWNLAWIQWLSGENEDALRTISAITDLPPMAHRVLAVILASLGREAEAREAVSRLLTFDPGYSMKDVDRNYRGKFRNPADLDRVLHQLRCAGLPE